MAEQPQMVSSVNWRELFPFLHILRTFRIAVHPSKLALGFLALLLICGGGMALDRLWPSRHLAPADNYLGVVETGKSDGQVQGIFHTFFHYEVRQVNAVADAVFRMRWHGPDGVPQAVASFLLRGPRWLLMQHPLFALFFGIWYLLIWSIVGGAIARIAAVHVARDEKISLRQAMRFSSGKILSFVFAPVLPLLIILFIGAILSAAGWILMHIPYAGPAILGILFVLPLLGGTVMAIVLLGTLGGINLMYPTVAVEGSDSFDAISRSFSYVYARPWRMLFYTAVALTYGALTFLFVRLFLWLLLALTHFFVGWWLGDGTYAGSHWPMMWPRLGVGGLRYNVNSASLDGGQTVGAWAIWCWVYLLIGLIGAYAISFYFSANTIIYYLMRREVDATEMDDVYVEELEDEFSEAPPGKESAAATAAQSTDTSAPPNDQANDT